MSHEREAGNWLQGFRFYTQISECPDSYLLWVALSTLSSALQRRVWVKWNYYKYYPNIYVVLVGPAGKTHKSSAIWFGKDFLRAIGASYASDAISKEALIIQMKARAKDSCSLAVFSSELGTFLRTSGPSMIEFLMDIYDCKDDFEYTTKSGGTDDIPTPYLTFVAGTTPAWMADEFSQLFAEGGFAARTIFIYETEPRFRKAFGVVTHEMQKMGEALTKDLKHISTLQGEFEWTRAGIDWFTHWYETEWPKEMLDYKLEGYLNRKPTHLLRLTQLVAVAEGDRLVLTPEYMQIAKAILDNIEPDMGQTFAFVGKNLYANDLERIAASVHRAGPRGLSFADIIRLNVREVDKDTLQKLLGTLTAMDEIEILLDGQQVRYRSKGRA